MRLLLLDTCAETGSLALAESDAVLRERLLPARAASAQLLHILREELASLGWPLTSLHAVGVVNGPGSFTGVRVGLAAAKGLCEVAGLKLVAVSRLAVLLSAAAEPEHSAAALDAGRGEFYVRTENGGEELVARDGLLDLAGKRPLLIAEDRLSTLLEQLRPHLIPLTASQSLALVAQKLRNEAVDSVADVDANYVRNARGLYAASSCRPQMSQP